MHPTFDSDLPAWLVAANDQNTTALRELIRRSGRAEVEEIAWDWVDEFYQLDSVKDGVMSERMTLLTCAICGLLSAIISVAQEEK